MPDSTPMPLDENFPDSVHARTAVKFVKRFCAGDIDGLEPLGSSILTMIRATLTRWIASNTVGNHARK